MAGVNLLLVVDPGLVGLVGSPDLGVLLLLLCEALFKLFLLLGGNMLVLLVKRHRIRLQRVGPKP